MGFVRYCPLNLHEGCWAGLYPSIWRKESQRCLLAPGSVLLSQVLGGGGCSAHTVFSSLISVFSLPEKGSTPHRYTGTHQCGCSSCPRPAHIRHTQELETFLGKNCTLIGILKVKNQMPCYGALDPVNPQSTP